MNRIFEIIKYTWKAKGRHGVHSPFVYELVDQCLRKSIAYKDIKSFQKKANLGKKVSGFFLRLLSHYKFETVFADELNKEDLFPWSKNKSILVKNIDQLFERSSSHLTNTQLVLLRHINQPIEPWIQAYTNQCGEEDLFILLNIRKDEMNAATWKKLTLHEQVHFTADFFEFGLFAKRSFQEKQHFTLKN